MPEKDTIFSSKIKYNGVFDFSDFYNFCHDWLMEETQLDLMEDKYQEKIKGDAKDIDIEWTGVRKVTDYFKFQIKTKFRILGLKKVEITQANKKVTTNSGNIEVKVSGTLIRDYEGKFETDAIRKFLRAIYEKWVIKPRIDEYEGKLIGECNEFLSQAKSYLDLESKG